MLSKINIESSVPVYIQIENEVQFAIASGEVKAGDRLPSVRDLSEQLKVNPNTVAKAYRDLEVMGLLWTRRGMGVFVANDVQKRCITTCREAVFRRIYETVSEAKTAGVSLTEIRDVVGKAYKAETGPYDDVPKDILSMVK